MVAFNPYSATMRDFRKYDNAPAECINMNDILERWSAEDRPWFPSFYKRSFAFKRWTAKLLIISPYRVNMASENRWSDTTYGRQLSKNSLLLMEGNNKLLRTLICSMQNTRVHCHRPVLRISMHKSKTMRG